MNKQKKLIKLKEEIVKLEKEIEQENPEVYYEDEDFKIIRWKNKKFSDFPMPKDYNWADFKDFCNLVNSKKIKPKIYEVFITKNPLPSQYPLFRACLGRDGDWCAYVGNLDSSNAVGRVVIRRIE